MTIIGSVAWEVPMMLTPIAQGCQVVLGSLTLCLALVNVLGSLCREEIGWAEHLETDHCPAPQGPAQGYFFFFSPRGCF